MFDSKFIATLFAVAISVIAICNINTNQITSNEGFGFGCLPSTDTRTDCIAANSMEDYYKGNVYSVPCDTMYKSILNNDSTNGYNKGDFVSNPNFQSETSPRFGNVGYGAYARDSLVKYGEPNINNLAVPNNPINYANMVNDDSQKKSSNEKYSAENFTMPSNYSEGNYNSLNGGQLMVTSDLLPVQNMSALNGVDKNGQPTQCVFFERIVHSNRNNRRRSQGDPIRGDLPIAPINNGWFNTSANPVEDLQQGALNVIGGESDTSKQMKNFMSNIDGKKIVDSVSLKSMSTNQNMNTVQVSR